MSANSYGETLTAGTSATIDASKYFNHQNSALNYTYEVEGLPDGMSFDSAKGQITGTPTDAAATGGLGGVYKPGTYMVRVTEIDPQTKQGRIKNVLIHVKGASSTGSNSGTATKMADGQVGTAYDQAIPVTGGAAPYTNFKITTGTLPPGLSVQNDHITGTPGSGADLGGDGSGNYKLTLSATDANGAVFSTTVSIKITAANSTATPLPGASVGTVYGPTSTLPDTGAPYTNATVAQGTLPAGLTLAADGRLSGTPAAGADTGGPNSDGKYSFTVSATDNTGKTVTQDVTIAVTAATNTANALPSAAVGVAYGPTQTLPATGGSYTSATVSKGTLPAGLSLASDGTISGTPASGDDAGGTNSDGKYSFTVSATDSSGQPVTQDVTLQVGPTYDTATDAQVGSAYTYTPDYFSGSTTVTSAVAESGSVLPDGLTLDATTGVISGTPSSSAANGGDNYGNYVITIDATGADGSKATKTIHLLVKP